MLFLQAVFYYNEKDISLYILPANGVETGRDAFSGVEKVRHDSGAPHELDRFYNRCA